MRLRAELLPADPALDPAADTVGPWRELAVGAGNAFMTPEWFTAWRRHYGRDVEHHVAVVRDPEGTVVGVLPVVVEGRAIAVAGANVADHVELLAHPERRLDAARAIGEALAAAHPRGHFMFTHVDEDAAWVVALAAAWPRRLQRAQLRRSVLPHLPITQTWDEFLAGRSRNFRNQIGRKERNLVRDHAASFRAADDPARLSEDMKRFFALHEARWEGYDGASSLVTPTVQQFHADFAAAAQERGWLRLWFLEADGAEVAAIYGWTVGGRACYFNAGWERNWSDASVGLVLLTHAVRSAFSEGADDYDFLLGDEQYKYRFATEERAVESIVVAPPLSPAQLGLRVERGVHRAGQMVSPARRAQVKGALGPVLQRLPGGRKR